MTVTILCFRSRLLGGVRWETILWDEDNVRRGLRDNWAGIIPDLNHRFLYRYGGSVDPDAALGRPFEDINYVPTNNIFKFDIENMSWTNLTDKIVFDPEGRFEFSNDPLPAIYGPSSAMVRFDGPGSSPRDFIFLFGGKREGRRGDTTSAELIFIDLIEQKWGISRVAGGTVPNRIGASMVCLDKKLFIFGGESDDGDPMPKPIPSYSILEYSFEDVAMAS
ncbi:hypothetical protein BDZ89DRAFT_1128409 [Hymenopellis radicata]|nr:hypothetical protein BDZ89DRAFT_1128409 [Hymenopellis radicata]